MQKRHKDRKQYFKEQGITTKKYVIPYIAEVKEINADSRILEIGCGEGGNLMPFVEMGCEVMGIDLNKAQIEKAKEYIHTTSPNAKAKLIAENIYDISVDKIGQFDVIFLRDVIEHIPHQKQFLKHLKTFMHKESVVFFGFPPWRMPFGGHQQICSHKLLSKLPYFHLLPIPLYKSLLKALGEKEATITELLELKETGISINRFKRIVKENGYHFLKQTHYFINPNYEIKFGLKPRKQISLIRSIPYVRDFFTTCMYSVIRIDEGK